jgi:hypothetical protein
MRQVYRGQSCPLPIDWNLRGINSDLTAASPCFLRVSRQGLSCHIELQIADLISSKLPSVGSGFTTTSRRAPKQRASKSTNAVIDAGTFAL